MMEPLYKEIVSKVDMEKFIVMGDSAGGGLALALEEKTFTRRNRNARKDNINISLVRYKTNKSKNTRSSKKR